MTRCILCPNRSHAGFHLCLPCIRLFLAMAKDGRPLPVETKMPTEKHWVHGLGRYVTVRSAR